MSARTVAAIIEALRGTELEELTLTKPQPGTKEYELRAIECLTEQLATAQSDNRKQKLQSRIDAHRKNLEGM